MAERELMAERQELNGRQLVVVSVGTDHHPFNRLVTWMDDWAAAHLDCEVVIQYGSSEVTTTAKGEPLIPHEELCHLFDEATVIVSHGGPSTVMDARSAGRVPIVVPRDPDRGEHIDGHQLRFAAHLARHHLAHVATEWAELEQLIDSALASPVQFRVPIDAGSIPGVMAFGKVVDELIGSMTPVSELKTHERS